MRALFAAVSVVATLALTGVALAVQQAWRPGSPYYIGEMDANRALERTFDSAYCDGIARFGHRGEFPYEEFLRFDCSTELNGTYCSDARYRSVKGTRRGYFRLIRVVKPSCF